MSFPLRRGRLTQHPTEFCPSLALLSYTTYGRAGPRPFERLRIMQKIINFLETSKVPNNYMVNTLSNVIYFYFLGADIIITYFVPQLLDWLSEN